MGIAIGLIVIVGGSVILRVWWASHPPKLPGNLRANSVWVEGSPAPFVFTPRGVWVSCWLDTQRNVDRCQFADYEGKLGYEGDYTTCDNQSPMPDERLRLQNKNQAVVRVFLQDGTMLIPANLCDRRNRSAILSDTHPGG